MSPRIDMLLAAAPTPETRRAVGEMSAVILLVMLIALVIVCSVVLLLLRRRSRSGGQGRDAAHGRDGRPDDAWAESARRVALEDDDDIPREPGTA